MRGKLRTKRTLDPLFIAIAGGSGAGKTWLATRLQGAFGKEAGILSLDMFYRDRSHLSPAQRHSVNFDHPNAIDWETLRIVITDLMRGRAASVPQYDFTTHARHPKCTIVPKKRIFIVEGLWTLRPQWLARLSALRIYVECPERTRRARRIARDKQQRGRTVASVCEQFDSCVLPMHRNFVEPQKRRADILLRSPLSTQAVNRLIANIKNQLFDRYAR